MSRRRTARRPETTQGADGNYVGGDLRQEFTINVGTAADAKKVLSASRTPSRRTVLLGGATLAATAGALVAVRLTGTDGKKAHGPRPLSDLFAFNHRDPHLFEKAGFTKGIDAVMKTPDGEDGYWLFSGRNYTLVQVTRKEGNLAEVVKNPRPLIEWSSLRTVGGGSSLAFKKIDAVMQWPDDRNGYWVFSGSHFLPIKVASGWPHMDTRIPEGAKPSPLSDWSSLSSTTPSFKKIDAVTRAPNDDNEYWVFSGSQHLRLRVNDGKNHDDIVVQKPKPLSEWGGLGHYPSFSAGVDAVMQMPDTPKEYIVFSGRQFIRTSWTGSEWLVK
ncbi:hypothetical protein [Streptomyces anulatus]|uniref:hypothetical protein n=1 Tax=Streptomyces anulatus TaxID=1892 RepID=UPI00364DCA97